MVLWMEVQSTELREGDTIRVFKGEFNRMESVVEKDEEGDLYADFVGYFTNLYSDAANEWKKSWDRMERLSVIPTEPGRYMSYPDQYILNFNKEGQWLRNATWITSYDDVLLEKYGPFTRLYTLEEATEKIQQEKAELTVD